MYGVDFQPLGNYVFIPLIVFGYAMFRKNLKDVLTLLNQSLFVLTVIVFLGMVSFGMIQSGATHLPWWLVFSGITAVWLLFTGYRKASTAVLSLFFGRQQEMLDRLHLRMTDRLSKSRSLNDLVHFISEPLFRYLNVKTLRILFYNPEDKAHAVFERIHPKTGKMAPEHAAPDVIPFDHPVLSLFSNERNVITQARMEARIADTDTFLDGQDLLRSTDIIQQVYFENTLVCLLLFNGKVDGSVYSKAEQSFIGRMGLILGPYIENAKLLQNLESKIEHRTRDLAAALQVKEDFLARMSHEIRSPLNVILGMGITGEHLSMIFDRFYQAETSTTRRFGGTGMGLTISRKIVGLMGGTLLVSSSVGHGSRFYFTVALPRTEKTLVGDRAPLNAPTFRLKAVHVDQPTEDFRPPVRSTQTRCMALLLAEDIACNAEVIRLYLNDHPITMDVTEDGEQAVRFFHEKPYDLVLMDIHMPVMDGYDAVRQIRIWEQDQGLERTPVVCLTAHKPDPSRMKHGDDFDAFLMKPIRKQDLFQTLARLSGIFNTLHELCTTRNQAESIAMLPLIRDMVNALPDRL